MDAAFLVNAWNNKPEPIARVKIKSSHEKADF
jgi:hypothetical protein